MSEQRQRDSMSISVMIDSIEKYINFNDHKKAYHFTLKGLKSSTNTLYPRGRVMLLERAASINCHYEVNLDSSVHYLNEMRQLATSIGFKKGLLWYELTLGKVYLTQNDNTKAYEFFSSAYKIAQGLNDSIAMGDILPFIARLLIAKGELDSAIICINRALDITRTYQMHRTSYMLYDRLAHIYTLKGNLDSAYIFYQKTLAIANLIESKLGILSSQFNLIYNEFQKNPRADVIDELRTILAKMKEEGFFRVYAIGGFILSNIMEQKGDHKQALQLYKEFSEFQDSIIGNENVRKVVERESLFYLNQKEFENQQLIKDAEIRELTLRNRKLIIIFSLVTLAISILLLLNIYKKYQQIKLNIKTIKEKERIIFEQEKALMQSEKEKLEQQMELQKKELSSKLMQLYQHNETIRNLTSELRELKRDIAPQGRQDKKTAAKLQGIINQISTSDQQQLWTEFEKVFNESNPDYLKRLSEKHPDLTPNEMKMCIFLNLNLRTKEISIITQQSVKAIDVARSRLRRKLGIDNTSTNITLYLQQI